jgi:hypothetical protein
MNNILVPILVVGFLILGTYKLFELFVRKGERLAIIEKLFTLTENKEISGSIKLPDISFGNSNNGSWALRVSLLLIGVGLGCFVAFIICMNVPYVDNVAGAPVLFFSCIAFFGGAGLLAAYLIESKQAKDK